MNFGSLKQRSESVSSVVVSVKGNHTIKSLRRSPLFHGNDKTLLAVWR